MKGLGKFFVLVVLCSCVGDDFPEKRKTIAQINGQIAYLDIEQRTDGQTFGYVFELQSQGEFRFLSVIDSEPDCSTFTQENCMEWQKAYLQYSLSKNDPTPSRTAGRRLWYKISGEVKESKSEDEFVGNPFVLVKSERVLSCPVPFEVIPGPVQFIDTSWKLIGFVDDSGKVYSHPACETNTVLLKFSSVSLGDYGLPYNIPDGKLIEVVTGDYLFYVMSGYNFSYSILEGSDQVRVALVNRPNYIPGFRNFVRHDGPRSSETMNKSDSLVKLLGGTDTLDFVINNNLLKLSNKRTDLKALFVAN